MNVDRLIRSTLLGTLVLSLLVSVSTIAQAGVRKPDPHDISLPDGYRIEPVVTNLSVPTTAIFNGNDLIIAESGWLNTASPRVLRITPDGSVETLAQEGLVGPVTGLLMHGGKLYVSHKGKVSVVEAGQRLRDIVTGLPSGGDHQNNNIVLGPDGKMYMGQGTTTNSGVVGEDSYITGWLAENPSAHEVPCKDITLIGENFETQNPLTQDNDDDKVTTGAYKPFGTASEKDKVIPGNVKCGGSILRFNPDGSDLEVYAWGLRNPFGLKFDGQRQLWATFHGADVRGSRSIFGDPDYFIQVKEDAWYGWPEFFDGEAVTENRFKDFTKPQPRFLWKEHPQVTQPFVTFDSHSAANGFAFSPGASFSYEGDAFVAMFGTFSIATAGTDPRIAGFKVARVDMKTKEIVDFATNKLPGPSYINQQGGFDRPSDIVFGPDASMYIIDWGASTVSSEGLKYVPETGVVWRVYADSMQELRPQGPITVPAALVPEQERQSEFLNVPEAYRALAGPAGVLFGVGLLVIVGILLLVWFIRRKIRKM